MDVSVVRTLQMLVIAQQLLAVALRGGGWCKADWNHSVFVSYGSLPLAGASQTICLFSYSHASPMLMHDYNVKSTLTGFLGLLTHCLSAQELEQPGHILVSSSDSA